MSPYCEAFVPDMALMESEFVRELTQAMARLALQEREQGAAHGARLEIHFLLPNGDDAPDFTGMRLRSWNAEEGLLLIESAVPAAAVQARNCSDYIIAVLLDAVDNAGEFFAERKVDFDKARHLELISAAQMTKSQCGAG